MIRSVCIYEEDCNCGDYSDKRAGSQRMQRGDSEVVAETKAGNITKEDLYQTLKDNAGADALNMLVQQKYSMINTMSPTKKSTKAERVQKSMGDQLNQLIDQKAKTSSKNRSNTNF